MVVSFNLQSIRQTLADEDPELIRSVLLSDLEWSVLNFIRRQESVVSSQVTRRFEWSPQQTSVTLRRLERKGYLESHYGTSPTGGPEYEWVPLV